MKKRYPFIIPTHMWDESSDEPNSTMAKVVEVYCTDFELIELDKAFYKLEQYLNDAKSKEKE